MSVHHTPEKDPLRNSGNTELRYLMNEEERCSDTSLIFPNNYNRSIGAPKSILGTVFFHNVENDVQNDFLEFIH